jgi:hypothetical protein
MLPGKPSKKRRLSPVSGVAATLFSFREKIPSSELSQYRKNPGELIAQAMKSAQAPAKKRGKVRSPRERS